MIESKLIAAGINSIAGVDEAGRGACAGPLVVAAVVLHDPHSKDLADVRDSKELSPAQREALFDVIKSNAKHYSIIEISAEEIDLIGLHRANLEGMRRAISALGEEPQFILTDGYEIEGLSSPSLAVWKGDQVAISISAASILAKVHRDQLMQTLDKQYPGYGLGLHKGYVTRAHQNALETLGVSPIHRRTYANVAALLNNESYSQS